jgi:hypothetical protein
MKLLSDPKNPSTNPLQILCSGNFDLEKAYKNLPVVLEYYTGGRL